MPLLARVSTLLLLSLTAFAVLLAPLPASAGNSAKKAWTPVAAPLKAHAKSDV